MASFDETIDDLTTSGVERKAAGQAVIELARESAARIRAALSEGDEFLVGTTPEGEAIAYGVKKVTFVTVGDGGVETLRSTVALYRKVGHAMGQVLEDLAALVDAPAAGVVTLDGQTVIGSPWFLAVELPENYRYRLADVETQRTFLKERDAVVSAAKKHIAEALRQDNHAVKAAPLDTIEI